MASIKKNQLITIIKEGSKSKTKLLNDPLYF